MSHIPTRIRAQVCQPFVLTVRVCKAPRMPSHAMLPTRIRISEICYACHSRATVRSNIPELRYACHAWSTFRRAWASFADMSHDYFARGWLLYVCVCKSAVAGTGTYVHGRSDDSCADETWACRDRMSWLNTVYVCVQGCCYWRWHMRLQEGQQILLLTRLQRRAGVPLLCAITMLLDCLLAPSRSVLLSCGLLYREVIVFRTWFGSQTVCKISNSTFISKSFEQNQQDESPAELWRGCVGVMNECVCWEDETPSIFPKIPVCVREDGRCHTCV